MADSTVNPLNPLLESSSSSSPPLDAQMLTRADP